MGFWARVREDIAAAKLRDPAARGSLEIALLYPGLHAIYIHKLAHWFWLHGMPWFGRFTSHVGRDFTFSIVACLYSSDGTAKHMRRKFEA